MATSKQPLLFGILATVIIGALVSMAGSDGSITIDTASGAIPVFALCGILAYAINWLVFIPSSIAKTEKYYDLTGSVTYLTVIATALVLGKEPDARVAIVAVMVIVWALRLGSFLFSRIKRDGRDSRFDRIKGRPLPFFLFWSIQALWVLLTSAAALAIITGLERKPLGWIAVIGIAVWVIGFSIEVVADQQKSAFKKNAENRDRFISSGLWAWSRHPNYFGEITLWFGVAIIALPVLSGWQWVALISPLFVTILLTRISGVPALEQKAKKKWGDEAEFIAYVGNTPVLIPRPPR